MTTEQLLELKAQLNDEVDYYDRQLKSYNPVKNELGLVPDKYKTGHYHDIKTGFSKAFKDLQSFNKQYAKLLHTKGLQRDNK